jgi:hypothetical protein
MPTRRLPVDPHNLYTRSSMTILLFRWGAGAAGSAICFAPDSRVRVDWVLEARAALRSRSAAHHACVSILRFCFL